MFRVPIVYFWFLGFLLFFTPVSGQSERYVFDHYTVEDGLPQTGTTGLYRDKYGFVWIMSSKSIVRFDGYSFTSLNYLNKYPELDNDECSMAGEDTLGTLYFCFRSGLYKLSKKWFELEPVPIEGISTQSGISGSFIARSGIIYLGGEGFLIQYNPYTKKSNLFKHEPNKPEGLQKGGIMRLVEDLDGNIWFSSWGRGLSCFYPSSQTFKHYLSDEHNPNSVFKEPIFTIVVDNQNDIWIGSTYQISKGNGMYRLDRETGRFILMTVAGQAKFSQPTDAYRGIVDLQGNLWFGSIHNGLFKYDIKQKKYTRFLHEPANKESVAEGRIANFYADNENNLWINTINRGVDKVNLNLKGVTFYNLLPVIRELDFTTFAIKEDYKGAIYICTNKGLFRKSRNSTLIKQITTLPYTNRVESLIFLSANEALISSQNFCGILNTETLKITPLLQHGFPSNIFEMVHQTKSGSKFIVNSQCLYFIASGIIGDSIKKIASLNEISGFNNGHLNLIETDSYYYFNYQGALLRVNKIHLTTEKILPNSYFEGTKAFIENIILKGDSILIQCLDMHVSYNVRTLVFGKPVYYNRDLLVNDVFPNSIRFDSLHQCLVSHHGVFIYDFNKNINLKADIFDEDKINPDVCLYASDSLIYLPAGEGIISFNPRLILGYNSEQSKVLITNLYLFNQNVNPGDDDAPISDPIHEATSITLTYKQSVIALEFKLLNFYDVRHNEHAYWLEGFDKTWNYIGNRNVAQFTNLPPGTYTFHYKASNRNGVWSNTEHIKITVLPPFWETWWFRIAVSILLVLFVFGFIRYRTRRIRLQKEELEKQVLLRTAEISSQKEEILAQKEEIENQQLKISDLYQEVTDSIFTAKAIQDSILPPIEEIRRHLPKSFVLYRPKDIVSGDFYFMHHDTNRTYIAAVDCTGHGVAGAFMSLIAHNLLNKIVESAAGATPQYLLEQLNEAVIKALHQESEHPISKDGMDVALCIINHDQSTLEYCGANNPLYVVRNNELIIQKADSNSVGIQLKSRVAKFTNFSTTIVPGDQFYIFSDGFAGQFGGETGEEKLKYGRFKDLILQASQLPMVEQEAHISSFLKQWMKHAEQTDDILLIGFAIN